MAFLYFHNVLCSMELTLHLNTGGGETPYRTNTSPACCAHNTAGRCERYSMIRTCVWYVKLMSGMYLSEPGREGGHSLEQTRWSHSKATPHTLGVSQLVWHQTICGPVYPREPRWSCGTVRACVRVRVCSEHCFTLITQHLKDFNTYWKATIRAED